MTDHAGKCLAVLCDTQGMIVDVLQNELAFTDAVPGRLFPRLVEQASRVKALEFLSEIRTRKTASQWELNFLHQNALHTWYFFGAQASGRYLITGGPRASEAKRLFDNLIPLYADPVSGQEAALDGRHSEPSLELYDQISRLNNELVATQRELARKNAELERLNQLKNQFIGMAAHDLRNPLGVIHTYSELLLNEPGQETNAVERADFLTQIITLSQFMLKMVNDLLSVSAIESGQLNLDLQRVDLPRMIRRNIERQRLLAGAKHIDITLEMDGMPPHILLDGPKIEQVLDNLIGNAVKFSNPGAAVQVYLCRERAGLRLSVQDHGPGISEEDMGKLFRPFGRTRVKPTGGERSTGLGLLIVKRIVEEHRGKIWLESRMGEGSTFFVSLPYDHEEIKA